MAKSKAKKGAPLQQGSLGVEQVRLLKKPLDHLGKQIEMPGVQSGDAALILSTKGTLDRLP